MIPVYVFISATRICFKCGRLGHTVKFCDKFNMCLRCGTVYHLNEDKDVRSCANKPFCINCGGEHSVVDYKCPEFLQRKDISKIMTIDNIPFQEAKRKVLSLSSNFARSLNNSHSNFPALNSSRGTNDKSFLLML